MSGIRIRLAAVAAALGALALLIAPAATAEVLHDQVDPTPPSFGTGSQDFEPAFDEVDDLAAEDFEVPAGEVWQLEKAFLDGRRAGTSAAEAFHVTLFASDGTLPGAERFATTVTPIPGTPYPDVELPLDELPILDSGIMWFAPQARLDGVSPLDPQQWFWTNSDIAFGSTAVWRNPGEGIPGGHDCLEFTPRTECLLPLPGGGPAFLTPHPGQSFRLEGNRAGAEFEIESAKAKGKGKLALTVNAPDVGELSANSKRLKAAGETVETIGDTALTLKPKGKTRRALADGERPKAKVKLTLSTASGETLTDSVKKRLKR